MFHHRVEILRHRSHRRHHVLHHVRIAAIHLPRFERQLQIVCHALFGFGHLTHRDHPVFAGISGDRSTCADFLHSQIEHAAHHRFHAFLSLRRQVLHLLLRFFHLRAVHPLLDFRGHGIQFLSRDDGIRLPFCVESRHRARFEIDDDLIAVG